MRLWLISLIFLSFLILSACSKPHPSLEKGSEPTTQTDSHKAEPANESSQEPKNPKEPKDEPQKEPTESIQDAGEPLSEPNVPELSEPETPESTEKQEENPTEELITEAHPENAIHEDVHEAAPNEGPIGDKGLLHLSEQEICKSFKKGPYRQLVTAAKRVVAGEILVDHNAYKLTLKASQSAYFKFDAWRKRDHYFFFNKDLKLAVEDLKGKAVPIKHVQKTFTCKDIKLRYTVNLPKEAYYYFKVGPASKATTVSIGVFDGHTH